MKRLIKLASQVENGGAVTNKSFHSFARKFKNDLQKQLDVVGAKISEFHVGHYYVSGFFRTKNDQCYYFSISDVRFFPFEKMMYRVATDEKDFTGGRNQYVNISDRMILDMVNDNYVLNLK